MRSFPEREKLEGGFGSRHPNWGRADGRFGEEIGAPAGMGSEAGSQPHTCGMSWLQHRLFSAQKTQLVLELSHIHPELSLTATTPPLGSSLVGESPQQTLTRLLEGEATSPCRNPLVPAPAPRATMPGALQGFPDGREKQLPSLQGPGPHTPSLHTPSCSGGPITPPQEQDKGAQPRAKAGLGSSVHRMSLTYGTFSGSAGPLHHQDPLRPAPHFPHQHC